MRRFSQPMRHTHSCLRMYSCHPDFHCLPCMEMHSCSMSGLGDLPLLTPLEKTCQLPARQRASCCCIAGVDRMAVDGGTPCISLRGMRSRSVLASLALLAVCNTSILAAASATTLAHLLVAAWWPHHQDVRAQLSVAALAAGMLHWPHRQIAYPRYSWAGLHCACCSGQH